MSTHSAGLLLIWKIASIEASNSSAKSIEPIHFLLGLLKVVDVDLKKVFSTSGKSDDQINDICSEVSELKTCFISAGIDTTRSRRRIRKELADFVQDDEKNITEQLRRSQSSRILFAAAEKLPIKDNIVTLKIFLEALIGTADQEMTRICVKADCPLESISESFLENSSTSKKEIQGPTRVGDQEASKKKNPPKSLLKTLGKDLNQLAKGGKLGPLFGRQKEVREMVRTLIQSQKNNLILIGDAGVGKTMLVEGLAQKIVDGDIPEQLSKSRIIELSMASLVAGTSYRGEFEERMQRVIDEASSNPEIILFFDEIHLMMGAGQASGSMDVANILKPALARGAIRVIGATTTAEYRKFIEKDPTIERRFQTLTIEEASKEEAFQVLKGLQGKLEDHHRVRIDDKAITAAIDFSVRYLPQRRLPDKAIDLLDQACSQVRLQSIAGDLRAQFRDGILITDENVISVIAHRCGIPIAKLTHEENDRLARLEKILGKRVKGQNNGITAVSNSIRASRIGLKNPNKPIGVFLFAGPSGTGKTELAKALTEALFDDENRLIRFDMSEFMDEHSVSRMIGSPPGYKDHDQGGQLTEKIRANPFSVVLFDEIEKAHPKILDLFLQLFDEGQLTDSRGVKCDFRESLIIMTSNLGAGGMAKQLGFGAQMTGNQNQEVTKSVKDAVKKTLRPELVSRISEIVVFNSLGKEIINEIIQNHINALIDRLNKKGISVSFDKNINQIIADKSQCELHGGREIEKSIERLVTHNLSNYIISNNIIDNCAIEMSIDLQGELLIARK